MPATPSSPAATRIIDVGSGIGTIIFKSKAKAVPTPAIIATRFSAVIRISVLFIVSSSFFQLPVLFGMYCKVTLNTFDFNS